MWYTRPMMLTLKDQETILRAGAHGADPRTLPVDACFREPVDDLAVARLLRMLENGRLITPAGRMVTGPSPFHGTLPRIVAEALRTGLAYREDSRLRAAPVHARSRFFPARPACGERTALRHRLLGGESIWLVDCAVCLDLPFSGVSYSTDE